MKVYEKYVVVNDVSFEVFVGSIFGFLGLNGVGKIFFICIIIIIIWADEGIVFLDGEKFNSCYFEEIGYMLEEWGFYCKMKVGEYLIYLACFKGLFVIDVKAKISGWMEKFGIEDWWDKKVEEFFKGM